MSNIKAHGCKVCGRTPQPRRSSSFRLCVEHTDTLFEYVGAPMTSGKMPWLSEDLRKRAHLMRARYAAATRLLGWEPEAKAVTVPIPQREGLL